MIAAHDALAQLGHIDKPTLVICGDCNLCTPLPLSEEIARAVPGRNSSSSKTPAN